MSEEVNRLEGLGDQPNDPQAPEESANTERPQVRNHAEKQRAKPAKRGSHRAQPLIEE